MKSPLDRLADHIGTIMVSTGMRLSDHLYRSDLNAIAEEIFEYFGCTTRPWIDDMSRATRNPGNDYFYRAYTHILVQDSENNIYIAEHRGIGADGEDYWVSRDNGLHRIFPVRWQPLPKNKSTENIT